MEPAHTLDLKGDEAIEIVDYVPPVREKIRRKLWSPWKIVTGILLLVLGFALWFVFSARSVWIQIEPVADTVEVQGGWLKLKWKDHYLMHPGTITVVASKRGYHPLQETMQVNQESIQRFPLNMIKLPGRLQFSFSHSTTDPVIRIGDDIVTRKLDETTTVEAGDYRIRVSDPRYKEFFTDITVAGMDQLQVVAVTMEPNWADVEVSSVPVSAEVRIGDKVLGTTPGVFSILAGEHQLSLKAKGYKLWKRTINLTAQLPASYPEIKLEKADGTVTVTTSPVAAAISINGRYQGIAPQTLKLLPGKTYTLAATKVGFGKVSRQIEVDSNEDQQIAFQMVAQRGDIRILGAPMGATIWNMNQQIGRLGDSLDLEAKDFKLEVRAEGYASKFINVLPKPGIPQTVEVRLLTVAQAREQDLARRREIITGDGQTMHLMRPEDFQMGASRRTRGRRSNEVLRDVELRQPYYVAIHEVTNARFKAFKPDHSSGTLFKVSLEEPDHPVVNVRWEDAARYCNWLSQRDGLPAAYVIEGKKIVPVRERNTGYRLLTEAEWAWAARFSGSREDTLLPWGESELPPKEFGNFADTSAIGLVKNTFDRYNDGFASTAPVGSFEADAAGIYDFSGNVSEWVQDIYQTSAYDSAFGNAKFHVIRGSSWQHHRLAELRQTFRDSGEQGRPDLGFRIGRYLE